MSLRSSFSIALAAMVAFALAIGAALLLSTHELSGHVAALADVENRVWLDGQLELGLFLHDRATGAVDRATEAENLRTTLEASGRYERVAPRAELFRAADEAVRAYLAAPSEETLRSAYLDIDQLVRAEDVRADELTNDALIWRSRTLGVGFALIVALIVGATFILLWFRSRALRPIYDLNRAIERYADGERSVPLPDVRPRELKAITEAFEKMRAAIRRHHDEQLTFLAGVAHDLRNPLAALRLSTAAASRPGLAPERAVAALALASRQVDRLDRMIGDLLDVTRLDAGRLDLHRGEVDLSQVADEVVDLLRPGAADREISVERPGQPCLVTGDAMRLEQVLVNLVTNAIKYSPEGSRVDVRVERTDGEAVLSVRDRGRGMSDADKERIFQPYRRLESARTSAPGTGLGLYVARRIVEAHGGSIDVRDAPEAGSIFRVRLPCRDDGLRQSSPEGEVR